MQSRTPPTRLLWKTYFVVLLCVVSFGAGVVAGPGLLARAGPSVVGPEGRLVARGETSATWAVFSPTDVLFDVERVFVRHPEGLRPVSLLRFPVVFLPAGEVVLMDAVFEPGTDLGAGLVAFLRSGPRVELLVDVGMGG